MKTHIIYSNSGRSYDQPPKKDINEFVKAASSKGLNLCSIGLLPSTGYIPWCLKRLKESTIETKGTKIEQNMLRRF